jgi:hypothetical protein
MSGQPVIVFDVNETLLDLDALHPIFDRIFAGLKPAPLPVQGHPGDRL